MSSSSSNTPRGDSPRASESCSHSCTGCSCPPRVSRRGSPGGGARSTQALGSVGAFHSGRVGSPRAAPLSGAHSLAIFQSLNQTLMPSSIIQVSINSHPRTRIQRRFSSHPGHAAALRCTAKLRIQRRSHRGGKVPLTPPHSLWGDEPVAAKLLEPPKECPVAVQLPEIARHCASCPSHSHFQIPFLAIPDRRMRRSGVHTSSERSRCVGS